jgi:hypothetical protein
MMLQAGCIARSLHGLASTRTWLPREAAQASKRSFWWMTKESEPFFGSAMRA